MIPPYTLPLQARIRFLQFDMVQEARLIEASYLEGHTAGDVLRANDYLAIADKYGINRSATLKALKTELYTNIETEGNTITYLFPSTIDHHHTKRGPKPRLYLVMNGLQVSHLIGALAWLEKPIYYTIRPDHITKTTTYKAEIIRQYIELNPGQYTRSELGEIFGMSARSTNNYDRRAKLIVLPSHHRDPIKNISDPRLAENYETLEGGRWLEDIHGKRYPALRECAQMMIVNGLGCYFVIRGRNHYDYAEQPEGIER